jgi:hypothetical protein
MLNGIGALALLATCLAMRARTSQNLVINGDFESGNTGFTTGYTLGGTAGAALTASSSGPITTTAQITVKDSQGVEITLKSQEKIALMFIETIASLEGDCKLHLSRSCSLAELVAGPKSPNWNIGKVKYDPALDRNYKYTVTVTGGGWIASANPQHAGLGGFFLDGTRGMIANSYYSSTGPATVKDKELSEISITGAPFQLQ